MDLGFQIRKDEKNYKIKGTAGTVERKECSINVGNAGTIARFPHAFLPLNKVENLVCLDLKLWKKDPCMNCLIAWRIWM